MPENFYAPKRFAVEGLFGYVNHEIDFQNPITILTGPNGAGKTHVLQLIAATMSLNIRDLKKLPFRACSLEFITGAVLSIERVAPEDPEDSHTIKIHDSGDWRSWWSAAPRPNRNIRRERRTFPPPWITEAGPNRWYDERHEVFYNASDLAGVYDIETDHRFSKQREDLIEEKPFLIDMTQATNPTFIDTKRLDRPKQQRSSRQLQGRDTPERIGFYIQQIRTQITEARRASLRVSQKADETFVSNLMKKGRVAQIEQAELVERYNQLSALSKELSQNALAGQVIRVAIPEEADSTQRRVLDLFFQDWKKKLDPLVLVHRKLQSLKRIINKKFIGKEMTVDEGGHVYFESSDGARLKVNQLSSGEQHILALFTLLLFSAEEGSTVLIDEPEISLHVGWKHQFVADVEEVADISNLTIVLATHSTAILNGRFELEQGLNIATS